MSLEERKHAATRFLKLVARGDVRAAFRDSIADDFRHHNPFFGAGSETIMQAMEENAKQHPDLNLEVLRTIGEDDLIAVHSRITTAPDKPAMAAVHIFRFEGDQIAELWDVVQAAPDDSPNDDGMF